MDPFTLALSIISNITKIYALQIEGATPEQRARMAEPMVRSMERWEVFLERLTPPALRLPAAPPPPPGPSL